MNKTQKDYEKMFKVANSSKEDVETFLGNKVYEACAIIEKLEGLGMIIGNGHHARQEIADYAIKILKLRWRDDSVKRN